MATNINNVAQTLSTSPAASTQAASGDRNTSGVMGKDVADQLGHAGALGLIGRTVTYYDGEDNPVTGVVEQVDMATDGKATLTINGVAGIDATRVTQVK
jgi:hypothetical protein